MQLATRNRAPEAGGEDWRLARFVPGRLRLPALRAEMIVWGGQANSGVTNTGEILSLV